MEVMVKCMWIQLFITVWTFTSVLSACELSNRIKRKDSEVTVSQRDGPCTLTFTANNNKQVVVVVYDMMADCVEKETVAIYDGNTTSGRLITNICQAYPWSFASRTHSLTLTPVPGKPLRPFSLDIHSFDPIKNYTEPVGIIRSERYLGYYSGHFLKTTPNNFNVRYQIMTSENVTIQLYFKELNIQIPDNGNCLDFVKIHGIKLLPAECGENKIIENVTTLTYGLSIQFKTDSIFTYSGFEVEYTACFEKRENSNTTESFHFPIYQLAEEMKCILDIKLAGRSRVKINMTIHSDGSGMLCEDILRIEADGRKFTEGNPSWCKLNEEISLDIPSNSSLILIFTSESKNEYVNGHFNTEKISEETSVRSVIEPSSSPMVTMQTSTSYTGINTSSEENPYIEDTELMTQSSDTSIVIIAASVASVFVIVISIIVLIAISSTRWISGGLSPYPGVGLHKNFYLAYIFQAVTALAFIFQMTVFLRVRRRSRHAQNDRKRTQKDTGVVNFTGEKDEREIYIGNEDYDVMQIKRKHKASPNEGSNNTYEGTYGPQNVYAVVNRMKSPQRNQGSDEYDDYRFDIVYDKTERLPVKARDENFYE